MLVDKIKTYTIKLKILILADSIPDFEKILNNKLIKL
jgi:hypothetical protein